MLCLIRARLANLTSPIRAFLWSELSEIAKADPRWSALQRGRRHKRDVEAVGQEGDEDVRLDACLKLVKYRPDRQVAPRLREGRLVWGFGCQGRYRSVATITAWHVDRLQLLEVEFDDGLW